MENLKLNWGKYRIAKNLNYYRIAEPTEAFWEKWKADKEQFKNQGISVYKNDSGEFKVYDWSKKEKATQEEYDKQEAIKERKAAIWEQIKTENELQKYRNTILGYIDDQYKNCRQKYQLIDEIDSAKDIDELYNILEPEAKNIEQMWESITTDVYSSLEYSYKQKLKEEGLNDA
jgi:hypothetical protein